MHLVNALPGVVAQGLIWGIMAIGVYITYRILDVADLTVDGTMATGGAAFIMLTMAGVPLPLALLGSFLAGVLAEAAGLFAVAIAVMALDLAQTLIFYRCPHCGWLLPFRHWSVPHCCPGCGRELKAPGR